MAVDIGVSAQNAACDAIVDLLDGGTIGFRTGAQPATCATADSGTLLGTCTFGTPAFGAASAGTATANAITDDSSADNGGTVGHFRLYTSGATCILQGSCTGTGGGGDIEFNNAVIVATGTISVSSLTVTVPAS